ncbi:MAG: nicotinamide-nucleotide adenylyltransferase [Clostridiales bacterium]|nr:nicotinamide-nucleotide adenylyltransferase [Clostridiales bacterium]
MRYKVGMYGGSFDPLHLGHISDIIKAAAVCEELYVVISWCEGRESTSKEMRYRWILNSTRHLPNVKILMVEDKAVSKEEYNTDYYWEKGAADIKQAIGKPLDAVFCGSDYLGTNRFESLYCPESEVIYFDRAEVPISSTDIRTWASGHWDYIPAVCRGHYARKVLIVGGESTGKSTLVQNLALAYNTNFVAEVGRTVCEYAGGEELMIADDMYEILLRHKVAIMDAAARSNRLLFVDTDAITTLFYSHFLLAEPGQQRICGQLASAINEITSWDLVIYLEPDVAFVQDGTRSETIHQDREKYSIQIKQLLQAHNITYHEISGDYLQRFEKAKQLIEQHLGITTCF